jgi:hypothetical protein
MITQTYTTYNAAYLAYHDLKAEGVMEGNISIISNDAAKIHDMEKNQQTVLEAGEGAGIGTAVGGAGGLLAGLGVIAIPGLGPVVAAGWLASTLVGMVAGSVVGAAAGGVLGLFQAEGLTKEEAERYARHIQHGGSVVCVRGTDVPEKQIQTILNAHHNQENMQDALAKPGRDKVPHTL